MRNRKNRSQSDPGLFRVVTFAAVIAIIALRVLKSLANTVVKTSNGLSESRNHRAA